MNKIITLIIIPLAALLLFSACSAEVEDTSGTDYLLAGYYMIAGEKTPLADDSSGNSRATVPAYISPWNTFTYALWIAGEANNNKINNYPERGQKTFVTVTEEDAANNVYFISARTEYPKKDDVLDYYLEEYYVQDDGDGIWNSADALVVKSGSSWVVDNLSRTTMEVHFQDGSVRTEWIDAVHTSAPDGTVNYAQFPLDGDLTIHNNWTPTTHSANADGWSSKVYYYQEVETYISFFFKENKEVFGVRYYTRSDDDGDGDFISSTLSFEHTISREIAAWDDSDWGTLLAWIFGDGESGSSGSSSGETLAETVIREQINEKTGQKSVRSSTKIVPTLGASFTIDKSIDYNLLD